MATATNKTGGSDAGSASGVHQLIEGIEQTERSALDAVKRFVDAVNDSFPDLGEDGPRQKIIDAAFRMTEQVVASSNQLATSLVDVTEHTLRGLVGSPD
ncbi:MAG: hypothetical protein R2698_14810 [Microthrixaceae bacterium]